ncbi:hypothetical protein GCM10009549_13910 [Streptomyces thermoalcalitolerans]|uniref:Uncharacterized protein n=1 Tax=Streptomyces thermoalcalitolerans TaxID=65605 RepID=A0ABN1NI58_9ACTN
MRRTPADRQRRQELADASVTATTPVTGGPLLEHFPIAPAMPLPGPQPPRKRLQAADRGTEE